MSGMTPIDRPAKFENRVNEVIETDDKRAVSASGRTGIYIVSERSELWDRYMWVMIVGVDSKIDVWARKGDGGSA
jgi:hypothetical protein